MKLKPQNYLLLLALAAPAGLRAELKLPAIFTDHMVLQQKQSDPIWGWDNPGTKVTVNFAGKDYSTEAGADGKWTVKLDPQTANATPQVIKVTGSSEKEVQDVLVGEVWMSSGQSNMSFGLNGDWNGDVEALASSLPELRLVRVPNVGTQELQNDFKGSWQVSSPGTAGSFSAVGLMFGRYLQNILHVPVGVIDNSWGGSAAEAWVRRETIDKDPRFATLMESTRKHEETETPESFQKKLAEWKEQEQAAIAEHKPVPRKPSSWLDGNGRPGNIFAGAVYPTLGYGLKGVIWYQGESNAGRAYEYSQLFPFMIEQWRKEWNQGDFPFYWVQLANFQARKPEPGDSAWAELRESQTKTLSLPHTGQAVIIDLGEGKDIHPKNKHDVAARLVRWALANDYGFKIPFHSPEFKKLDIEGNKAIVTIDTFGGGLRTFDVKEANGFAVAGEDRQWHWAQGALPLNSDKIELTCDAVPAPKYVRYAWGDNPTCNVLSNNGLPLTPFRTDDFDMITKPKAAAATPAPKAAATAAPAGPKKA